MYHFPRMNCSSGAQTCARFHPAEGARQIGLGDSLSPVLKGKSVELVRADLLEEGEKVRHKPEKLAQIVLDCALKAKAETYTVR